MPTLAFADDGTVSGFAGCNTYGGPFSTDGGTIAIGPLAATEMACQGPGSGIESVYLPALRRGRPLGDHAQRPAGPDRSAGPHVPGRLTGAPRPRPRATRARRAVRGASPRRWIPTVERWLDLERVRRRQVRATPSLEHDSVLHRRPLTTLDDHLAAGLRVAALADLVDGFEPRDEDDEAVLDGSTLRFGPPVLRPPSIRDGYGFQGHVGTMWARRGADIPEAWFRLPIFYFSNPSEIRGPDDPIWAPRGSQELDYELEVAAVVDTPAIDLAPDRAEEAFGGYMVFGDWSARDLQRDETAVRLGPAKGKDFASSFGPWLVTPDELADRRAGARVRPGDGRPGQRHRDVTGSLERRGARPGRPGGAGERRRPPATGRPARVGHGRRRLPARGARDDDRALPGARRCGRAGGGAARRPPHPIVARPARRRSSRK